MGHTDEHPHGEPDEGDGGEPEHQVDVDEDAQDGEQRHAGGVEAAAGPARAYFAQKKE